MSTYVISDIHGEYLKLIKMLRKIHFSEVDTMYVLGDVLDRGPYPIQVIRLMIRHSNIIPIMGNHEAMGLPCMYLMKEDVTDEQFDALDDAMMQGLMLWHANGSSSTVAEFEELSREEREEIIEYIEDFLGYEEITVRGKRYLMVHAGLGNFDPKKPLSEYTLHELVWDRPDFSKRCFMDRSIIVGHTPTQLIEENPRPGYIYRGNGYIAIDCGACFEDGRLAALCLDTGEEFYVD